MSFLFDEIFSMILGLYEEDLGLFMSSMSFWFFF